MLPVTDFPIFPYREADDIHPMSSPSLILASEERAHIERVRDDASVPAERRRRAAIVLGYADGSDTRTIATRNAVSESRARFWRGMFARHGMIIFNEDFSSESRRGARHKRSNDSATPWTLPDTDLAAVRTIVAAEQNDEHVRIARILLLYHDGLDTAAIAEAVQLSASRVRYWRRAFETRRLALFHHSSRASAGDAAAPSASDDAMESTTREAATAPPASSAGKKRKRIAPGDGFAYAVRQIMGKPLQDLRNYEGVTDFEGDVEIVHRMRVATRRLRSAFELFHEAFDLKAVKGTKRQLRRLARLLGKVRDRDVLIEHMGKHLETVPEQDSAAFARLIAVWRDERLQHVRTLEQHVTSDAFPALLLSLQRIIDDGAADAPVPPHNQAMVPLRIGDRGPVLLLSRYTDILAFAPIISTATLDMLHSLRIHCKQFRYALEFLRDLLGKDVSLLLDDVVAMQDILGGIQDAQTAGMLISDFIDSLEQRQLQVTFTERINPAPLLHYLAMRQTEKFSLLAEVDAAWQRLTGPDFRQRLLATLLPVH